MTITNNEQSEFADLVARTAIGDQAAFKRLYDKTASRAFSLVVKMVGSESLAQDLLQEAYVKVWNKAKEYRTDKGTVISWLLAIARYRALDFLRTDKRRTNANRAYEQDLLISQTLAGSSRDQQLSEGLIACLEKLGPNQRETILHAFFHGRTHKELAARASKPIGTVKSQIRRGLMLLKTCMESI